MCNIFISFFPSSGNAPLAVTEISLGFNTEKFFKKTISYHLIEIFLLVRLSNGILYSYFKVEIKQLPQKTIENSNTLSTNRESIRNSNNKFYKKI